MIYGLANVEGIDNEDLHSKIYTLVKKESIAELSKAEASVVIDYFMNLDRPADCGDLATDKQKFYIKRLCLEAGFMLTSGKVDERKLDYWVKGKFGVSRFRWITKAAASDAIEGLKKMGERARLVGRKTG